jgi:hypothetical protein
MVGDAVDGLNDDNWGHYTMFVCGVRNVSVHINTKVGMELINNELRGDKR